MDSLYMATDFSTDKRVSSGLWYDTKIGYTNNVTKRIRQVQTCRPNICIVWVVETSRKHELRLHVFLKAIHNPLLMHHAGEWYWIHEDAFMMQLEGFVSMTQEFRDDIGEMLGLIASGEMPRE